MGRFRHDSHHHAIRCCHNTAIPPVTCIVSLVPVLDLGEPCLELLLGLVLEGGADVVPAITTVEPLADR